MPSHSNMNKEPISRNGIRLLKDDVVRVLECCSCKSCTPFKGSLATITATQDEDEWLRRPGTLLLRLKMESNRTWCRFRACNVDFVSRKSKPTRNQVYIDHMYERLIQNATPEELHSLEDRLKALRSTQKD